MTDTSLLESVKVSILSRGLRVDQGTLGVLLERYEKLTVHEYPTTAGLTLELPAQVLVNAPFDEPYCDGARASLQVDDGSPSGLSLRWEGSVIPVVRFIPLPGYLESRDSTGHKVTDVAFSHADRVRLSPLVGCAYDCGFCDLPGMVYKLRSAPRLTEALAIACSDRVLPPRHVLISGGSPRKRDYDAFEEVVTSVVRASPLPVDIMMSPLVGDLDMIDRLVEAGITGFSINIEAMSPHGGLTHLPMKYKVTRRHFEAFVRRAVEVTGGKGSVRSLIIPGLEPLDATLNGVELIASLGADPVLSPFRPARGTALENKPPVGESELHDLLAGARSIVETHGVRLGPDCVFCQHNTLTFPWDTR